MPYLLVRLEVAYGRVGEFSEVMSHLVPVLERSGWRLHGAFVNQIGRLNRCYDLWEIPDANGVRSVLDRARQDPEFRAWSRRLDALLIEEELEVMDELPYFRARAPAPGAAEG
jgi:hypothetical protein